MGGLGNQMFQYALGRNLSLIHNTPFKVDYSYLKVPNQSQRTLRVGNYRTILEEVTDKEIASYTSTFQKILDKIRSNKKMIVEKSNIFDPNILLQNDGYFYGYWNDEKYFEANEKIIRDDFKLKAPFGKSAEAILERINVLSNSTSIHIRRGDYVSIKKIADTHGTLPFSYYENAIDKIKDKFPDVTFFVFSDDIEWAKKNFPRKYSIIFVSNPLIPDYEELMLMSLCKHNITANSTFSWWAAWLNANPNKIVVAPKKWFVDETKYNDDLIPENWIKL
ncbi:MAG: Glycosyl transferase, family 11 [Parcubacteria group bacterium GW2011_GWF2_39_8b]|nr:MAG: Glycosyl transferase, family 11 [Parcubacteria group bacterium GW2011_GWF2_39_8b]